MSKRSEILRLLNESELTTKEIQEIVKGSLNVIQAYMNQFKKAGKVEKIGNKGKFAIYKAIKTDYEKNMNGRLLHDKIDKLEKFKIGFKQYNSLFEKVMETIGDKEVILSLAEGLLDLELLDELELIK